MIQVNQELPDILVKCTTSEVMSDHQISALLDKKKTVLFAIPGAFTPICTGTHVPGFIKQAAALKARGIDQIICLSVNDAFVMQAYAQFLNVKNEILMLADEACALTNALGLTLDLTHAGLGMRSNRYVMVLEGRTVKSLMIEENVGACTVSSVEEILKHV